MNGTHSAANEDSAAQLQRAIEAALLQETGLRGIIAGKFAARILYGLRRAYGGVALRIPPLSSEDRRQHTQEGAA